MGEEMRGRVSLDLSAFERAALKGQQVAKNFGVSVEKSLGVSQFKGMVAGALSVAAVTSSVNALLEKADGIDALAKRFDITAEGIQSIQYAANQTGASADAMFTGIKKLSIAVEEARMGNKGYIASLAALGVSLQDAKSRSPEQLFFQIGQRINGTTAESVNLTDGIKVFGRTGDQVLGAMRDGFAGVASGAKKAGVVIEENLVRQLAEAKDQLSKFNDQVTVLKAKALGTIVGKNSSAMSAALDLGSTPGGKAASIISLLTPGGFLARYLGGLSVDPGGQFSVRKAKKGNGSSQSSGVLNIPEMRNISFSAPNLTDNQRIGAFSNQNPFLNRQLAIEQEMVKIQNAIKKATEDTAKAAQATARSLELQTF